jgi:hypothetical protein
MKEKPIIFSAPMVRAILENRKNQTRRVVKPQPSFVCYGLPVQKIGGKLIPVQRHLCPYGQPGDRLWVRETWAQCYEGGLLGGRVVYRADVGFEGNATKIESGKVIPWKPSIYMPRWASRITLEIVNVRVERVQEISEVDAEQEGVPPQWNGRRGTFIEEFRKLWDSINAKRPGCSWVDNPLCRCISFERV